MDDNIKTIRQKITVSIPISDKFGEDIKLLPEYQYFWTEYNLKNTIDYVMLGQKWIRKNELVKIDIKPNDNLTVYENCRSVVKIICPIHGEFEQTPNAHLYAGSGCEKCARDSRRKETISE